MISQKESHNERETIKKKKRKKRKESKKREGNPSIMN